MDIYAELKGLNPQSKQQEIHELIVAVGLFNKLNKRSKSLSGGMKRKLSLAIALMGDCTKVIGWKGGYGCAVASWMCAMSIDTICMCGNIGGSPGRTNEWNGSVEPAQYVGHHQVLPRGPYHRAHHALHG